MGGLVCGSVYRRTGGIRMGGNFSSGLKLLMAWDGRLNDFNSKWRVRFS